MIKGQIVALTNLLRLIVNRQNKAIPMKRLFLMVVAMLSMTMAFAENESVANIENVEAYDLNVNMNKLGKALRLNSDQMDAVKEINQMFANEMRFAAEMSREDRVAFMDKALKKNVLYMDYVLNKEQYRKYLLLLNLTLRNRGLID